MNKILPFLLLIFGWAANAQIVTLNANLKAKLLSATALNGIAYNTSEEGPSCVVDSNGNGEIEVSEALAIKRLILSGGNITNFTGLEAFVNLEMLYSTGNHATNVNFSTLTNLTYLLFNGGFMTSVDVSALVNLTYLEFGSCFLTSLDVSSNPLLEVLICDNNDLTSIDISQNVNLDRLILTYNELPALDVSHLVNLTTLSLYDNPMPILDVSNLRHLTFLSTGGDQMTHLFMKNNNNEFTLQIAPSPNLAFICADESEITAVQNVANTVHPGIEVNSYCSFVPGGDYNTISGQCLYDLDGNGCGSGDVYPVFIKVRINDGTNQGYTFVNADGNYAFYTQQGNFTVTPVIENQPLFNLTPANANVNFPAADNSLFTQDFCITANGIRPDVEVVIVPITAAIPGFVAAYKIIYRNKGNQSASGNITFQFQDALMDFVSSNPSPNAINGGLLSFDYAGLLPFQTREITVMLEINSPIDIPPVNAGDVLGFSALINPVVADEMPGDNLFELKQKVIASLDPNDKTCLEGETTTPELIGKYLHYNINFENIGTAEAVNIVVKDLINPAQFDINTLQVMYASHPVRVLVTGNKVEFIFENINLPSVNADPIGGHGNVLFKIKTLPTLQPGNVVTNTANIYFDYNHPIVTNEARTTFSTLQRQSFDQEAKVTVHPNPVKNTLVVNAQNNIRSIAVFDAWGRILKVVSAGGNQTVLDLSDQGKGVYFVKITTDDGTKIEKIIKE